MRLESIRHDQQCRLCRRLTGRPVQNIAMTLVGALAFSDFRFHPFNAAGLVLSMAGAIYYATKTALRVRAEPHCIRCPAYCCRAAPEQHKLPLLVHVLPMASRLLMCIMHCSASYTRLLLCYQTITS